MTDGVVLVVANSTEADAGYVGERLKAHGKTLRTLMRDRAQVPVEVPAGVDALILLGSHWSVPSPVAPEALRAECALVRSARHSRVPVLGLCYGAQILAEALGGRVSRAARAEVGLIHVDSDDVALVPTGPWPSFHVDLVDPPPEAWVVARNDCGTQAFLLPGMLGVQFHPEVRPDTLAEWTRRFPWIMEEAGVDPADLVERVRGREQEARSAGYALVDAFLDRVAPALNPSTDLRGPAAVHHEVRPGDE